MIAAFGIVGTLDREAGSKKSAGAPGILTGKE
jgi:hypothetical protein